MGLSPVPRNSPNNEACVGLQTCGSRVFLVSRVFLFLISVWLFAAQKNPCVLTIRRAIPRLFEDMFTVDYGCKFPRFFLGGILAYDTPACLFRHRHQYLLKWRLGLRLVMVQPVEGSEFFLATRN
jgi:hypothetical protein